ncbi:MAG: SulP family inorganic anion transporter [Burkholderiaceae bacterium]
MFRLRFRPALVDALKTYRRDDLVADVSAGITVGFVALPLAMAFGIASGVKPEQGLATAIVGGMLISLLGGSRVQIGGPAGAFVALLYAIAARYGIANLLLATMMAGVLLFAMGALRLGNLIRFIPVAVVVGFTNGIAVIIALQQVRDFLGLQVEQMPANFFSMVSTFAGAIHTIHWPAIAVGIGSLAIVAWWPRSVAAGAPAWLRWMSRAPGTIAALALGIVAVSLFDVPVETIGSRFGGIPQGLPMPALPEFEWSSAQNLAGPAISIALLCAIESLLCARVADKITGQRHDSNQELMGQGVANFVSPLFGGIAATGTIARTVTNVRSGGRTPLAGVFHALTLLLIMLVFAPYAGDVPMATLAAILLHVAWNMGDWAAFPRLRRFSMNHRALMLTTFALTIVFDLTVAVQVGLVLASLFFIYRVSALTRIERIDLGPDIAEQTGQTVRAYRLFGSLFFGSVGKLDALQAPRDPQAGVMILEMHQVINLDTSGLEALEELLHSVRAGKGRIIIVAPNEQPRSIMERSGFLDQLGPDSVYATLEGALASLRLPPADEVGDEGGNPKGGDSTPGPGGGPADPTPGPATAR